MLCDQCGCIYAVQSARCNLRGRRGHGSETPAARARWLNEVRDPRCKHTFGEQRSHVEDEEGEKDGRRRVRRKAEEEILDPKSPL
eukprot:4582252-Pyramimonas_sp.AAC.1